MDKNKPQNAKRNPLVEVARRRKAGVMRGKNARRSKERDRRDLAASY